VHVAVEYGRVYWNAILLNLDKNDVLVANAQRVKSVPGRNTHAVDSRWISVLLGIGKYVSRKPLFQIGNRELRELNRKRRSLLEGRSRDNSRVQKVL
jgi:transposase